MDAKAVQSSIVTFSAKFCNELNKTKSMVSSPLSAEMLLALITLGTEDPAHEELINSLAIPDDDAIRSSFALISSKLKATQGVTLNVANKVYIKEGNYDLNPQLKEDAVEVFDAGFEKIDFDDGSKAAHTINKWVESKTNERIKDVVSADSLNSDSRLVFVNALYFKGKWEKQFESRKSIEKPFHIDNEKSIEIPMMHKEDHFTYGESETLGAQMLQMFYKGEEASMLIVLPREVTGLDSVLQKLADGHDLLAELDNMYKTKVQVILPKFKIETAIDLNVLLPKLGIKAIFNPGNSGLTKILNTDEPLFVSKAVQKAFIEVNEVGSEAAAATAMAIRKKCEFIPRHTFVADRPSLWLLLVAQHAMFAVTFRGVPVGAPVRGEL